MSDEDDLRRSAKQDTYYDHFLSKKEIEREELEAEGELEVEDEDEDLGNDSPVDDEVLENDLDFDENYYCGADDYFSHIEPDE